METDNYDLSINIHQEVFNKDFDEVDFEPHTIDDSNKEAQEEYGY